MKPTKILIGPSSFGDVSTSPLQELRAHGCEIIRNPYRRKLTKTELISLLQGVTGLIAGLEILDKEVLHHSTLRSISRCGSGLSNIDLESAKELGITVDCTPDGPTEAVAEATLGSLLTLLRRIPSMDRAMHQGTWHKQMGRQLREKKIAILGYGRIGQRFAQLLEPFEVDIMVVDPNVTPSRHSFKHSTLYQALQQADILSIHISGEKCLLDRSAFRAMKRGMVLLNAARGKCVDERALIESLELGTVSAAWLDTFVHEPYQGALTQYDQVLLTPHIGSYTREGRQRMESDSVKNLIRALNLQLART